MLGVALAGWMGLPRRAGAAVASTDAALPAVLAPPSARLRYSVHSNRFPYRLGATLHWSNLKSRYVAEFELGALGLTRRQRSEGRITPGGLQPERFSDDAQPDQPVRFDAEQGRIHFKPPQPDAVWVPEAQDRLSVLLQLGFLQAQLRAPSPGLTLGIPTAGPHMLELWQFEFDGEQTLDLPSGRVPALAWSRLARAPGDQRLQVWLAPQLDDLPARLLIREAQGDAVDQRLIERQAVPADKVLK
ncbi:MAG: hypothetical protein Fur007_03200 [Rhodoferax sp.]